MWRLGATTAVREYGDSQAEQGQWWWRSSRRQRTAGTSTAALGDDGGASGRWRVLGEGAALLSGIRAARARRGMAASALGDDGAGERGRRRGLGRGTTARRLRRRWTSRSGE